MLATKTQRIAAFLLIGVLLCGGVFVLTKTNDGNISSRGISSPLDNFQHIPYIEYDRKVSDYFVQQDAQELVASLRKLILYF